MAAGLEAATAGALAEVAFTEAASVVVSTVVASAEVVSAAADLAAEDSVTLAAAGDLTTEDWATEDLDAGSDAASEIMDFMAVIPIRMTAILITTTTTGAIIRERVRLPPGASASRSCGLLTCLGIWSAVTADAADVGLTLLECRESAIRTGVVFVVRTPRLPIGSIGTSASGKGDRQASKRNESEGPHVDLLS